MVTHNVDIDGSTSCTTLDPYPTPITCTRAFEKNTSVILSGFPGTGFRFDGWSGEGCSGNGNCVVTMSQTRAVTARFSALPQATVQLSVLIEGRGVVSHTTDVDGSSICTTLEPYPTPATCTRQFAVNTPVTLTASAAAGYSFSGWSGEGCATQGVCSLTMSQARTVSARFSAPLAPTWVTKASMPQGRVAHVMAAVGGLVYVIGGYDGSSEQSTVWAYDPATDSWTTRAPLPEPRYQGSGAVVLNGEIYVPGGWAGGSYRNTLFIYNPLTNTWRSGPAMPTTAGCGVSGVIGGKLYVTVPCIGSGAWTATHLYEFDPASNAWTRRADAPLIQGDPVGVVLGGRLHVAGGQNAVNGALSQLNVYDPATDTWSGRAGMSNRRYQAAGEAHAGKLHVIGGYSSGVVSLADRYDPVANAWESLPSMPAPRFGISAARVGNIIYVAGGTSGGSSPQSSVYALTLP